jgi:hypothetical protein
MDPVRFAAIAIAIAAIIAAMGPTLRGAPVRDGCVPLSPKLVVLGAA